MSEIFKAVNATLKKSSGKGTEVSILAKKLAPSNLYKSGGTKNTVAKDYTADDFLPINAQFMEREDKSEEELKAEAREYADNVYKNKSEALDIKTAKQLNTLDKRLGDAKQNEAEFYENAAKSYASERENINDRAIKNGIVNSSIFAGLNAAAESRYAEKLNSAAAEYGRLAQQIRTEIELVNAEKELALRDYELKKAAEYDKKLASLRREEMAARQEVEEYNKELADFLAHYDEAVKQSIENWRRYNEATGK